MTLSGTNTYLVGGDVSYIVDPGPGLNEHISKIELAVASSLLAVRAILLTHHHPDHVEAAPILAARLRLPVLASERSLSFLHSATFDSRTLQPGEELPLSQDALRVIASPGHTRDHISFLALKDRALLCGDVMLGEGTPVIAPPDGDMQAYMETLNRFLALNPETIYPGHGAAITNPQKRIKQYIRHRLDRERQIVRALTAGQLTLAGIVQLVYPGLDSALTSLAEMSVRAHLDKLQRENRVVVEENAFRLA